MDHEILDFFDYLIARLFRLASDLAARDVTSVGRQQHTESPADHQAGETADEEPDKLARAVARVWMVSHIWHRTCLFFWSQLRNG